MDAIAANSYFTMNNSCVAIPHKNWVRMSFYKSNLTKYNEPMSNFNGNYTVYLATTEYWSVNSPTQDPLVLQINADSGTYFSPYNIFFNFDQPLDPLLLEQKFDQPMLGFRSGEFRIDTLLANSFRTIFVTGYWMKLIPARATSISVTYGNITLNQKSNLTISMTAPCAYLTKDTSITIEYPTVVSNNNPLYYSAPLAYVDAYNCNILINGVRPPGMSCVMSNGTLTLNNIFTEHRLDKTMTIFVDNVTTPFHFFGFPTIKFHEKNALSYPYLMHELNGTTGNYSFYTSLSKYNPKIINSANFNITGIVFGFTYQIPLNPGFTIKFNITDDFIGTTPIKIILKNRLGGAIETGIPTKTNGIWSYVLTQSYTWDWGIDFSIQGLNAPLVAPPIAKTYYFSACSFSQVGRQIGAWSTSAMTFKAA